MPLELFGSGVKTRTEIWSADCLASIFINFKTQKLQFNYLLYMYLKVKDNAKSCLSISGIGTKLVSRGKVNFRSRGITLPPLLFWNQAHSVFNA